MTNKHIKLIITCVAGIAIIAAIVLIVWSSFTEQKQGTGTAAEGTMTATASGTGIAFKPEPNVPKKPKPAPLTEEEKERYSKLETALKRRGKRD